MERGAPVYYTAGLGNREKKMRGNLIPRANTQKRKEEKRAMQGVIETVQVIDSHTGGEPTRIVITGGPDLGRGSAMEQLAVFREKYDYFRSAVVNEPRGSDVLVGALLTEPADVSCAAGVIFFNNVGYLGMCGHGTMGLMATLAHLKRVEPGRYRIETPAGIVAATLHTANEISVRNVPARREAKGIEISVEGYGEVAGDVAWGGNWFFLTEDAGPEITLANAGALTDFAIRVRRALVENGVTGANGAEIDHVEISSASPTPHCDSRNFVLCPGGAYDRSPCGTGTSAKLACLFADGRLREGEIWRQESVTGSIFLGSIETDGDLVIPTIRGSAFVNGESTLLFNPADPCRYGMK